MRRSKSVVACLAGVGLILSASATASSNDIVNPRIEPMEPAAERLAVSGPPRGIRSYGKGATRPDVSPIRAGASIAIEDATGSGQFESAAVAAAVGSVRKISGTPMAGSVAAFNISPDGRTAVYIADQATVGRFELYSVPVDGSATPTKISSGLPFGAGDDGVKSFEITPDSASAVFLADPNAGGGVNDIFSVPIDGSATAVQLNAAAAAPVTGFGVSPNSIWVSFFGIDTAFGGTNDELYSAQIGTASSATQVSDASQTNTSGNVVFADFSPNSARVVYAADSVADEVFQWHSVLTNAGSTGTDVRLTNALTSVSLMDISPDSATIVYSADENNAGVMQAYARPIGGGSKTQLTPAQAGNQGNGVVFLEISPDGTRVGYLADQNSVGVVEVYSAQIDVLVSGSRVNTPMSGTQSADTLNISHDSSMLLYEADQDTPGTFELFSVPIDGSSGPTTLQEVTAPDNAGFFTGLGTPLIGKRAVYPVLSSKVNLYSVMFDGSEPSTRINAPLAAGDTVFSGFLPESGAKLMAWGEGPSGGALTNEIHAASIRGDLPTEQINVTAGSATLGVLAYAITSDENYAVYLQDQDTTQKPELYSRELDSDADTVINANDNCPFVANASQNGAVFGPTVLAENETTFTWNGPTEVRFVRGPLAGVDVLATDDSGTLLDVASYTDAGTPAPGAGFYYLFAPDCPDRSYQTAIGSEPARDSAGFP